MKPPQLNQNGTVRWLQTLSDDDVLRVAQLCREALARRIDQADTIGDGPRVNALCAATRKQFTAGLRW